MRSKDILAAYLDDFNLIKYYFNKISYGGKSNKFYLKDNTTTIQELPILKVEETNEFFIYYLEVKNIEIGKEYLVEHEFARTTPLQFGLVVKTKQFDELYAYEGNDLGATFKDGATTFKVFAPTSARMQLILENEELEMKKNKGIFELTVNKDLHDKKYRYRVFCSGTIKETIDPYCIKTTKNNTYSIAYDTQRLSKPNFVGLKKYTDAIIYEASIADFTAQFDQDPSTFISMTKPKSVNYIKDLGITHLQLLPVTSCGSTDDYLPSLHYNWGYDITHFQALTNRYAKVDSVSEFKNLVEVYHQENIGIVLDMVFNHVHDYETSCLQVLVPFYYFQMNEHGQLSNGTFCGNDFDSKGKMASKLVVDSCLSWVKNFGVDGFRFDLMGILDTDTMNEVYNACQKINPSFILYGEGWNMPSYLEEDRRASIQNQAKMSHIAHFNDFFRDVLKGKHGERGYLTHTSFSGDNAIVALLCRNYDYPSKSISYFECHDNHTLWDYLTLIEEDEMIRKKKMKLLVAAIFLSYGIPFIHSGQEFMRTKNGLDNTYRDNSGVNEFDWQQTNHEFISFVKKLIIIRKQYSELRIDTKENDAKIQYLAEDIIEIQLPSLVIVYNPTPNMLETKIEGQDLLNDQAVTSLTVEPFEVYVIAKNENSCCM